MRPSRRAVITAGLGLAAGLAPAAEASPGGAWRVCEAVTGWDLPWGDLPRRLQNADAVFVGEQHGDSETHRVEAALLSGLYARVGDRLTLALEMLERDGQPALEDYLAGRIAEEAFVKAVTLWPSYHTDYRPLVEYARTRRLPVLAANVPRRIARAVSRAGLAALANLPEPDRALAAAYVTAPDDLYAERFRAVIERGHDGPGGTAMDAATIRRFYEAQCLKDDTMAESVARAVASGRIVLHVNGSFHSDAGLGAPARLLWRRPLSTRVAVVKIVPVSGEVSRVSVDKYRGEADFLVFVPDTRPENARG